MRLFPCLTAVLWFSVSCGCISLRAQKPLSISQRLNLSEANQNLRNGYFLEAKTQYESLLSEIKDRPELNFFAGQAAFELRRYQEAFLYFSNATFNPGQEPEEFRLYFGKTYFILGQPDSAETQLKLALNALDEKEKAESEANLFLNYIMQARASMAKPENVRVKPIQEINTPGHESSACLSLDGKTMYLTSSRPENTGGAKDEAFDMYFQDIWVAQWDSLQGRWSNPVLLPGEVNTTEHDASLGVSPQGDLLFVYKSEGGGNIYYTRQLRTGMFKAPKPMEGQVNSSYFESSASMSADRKFLYLISEREKKGAQGSGDIWIFKKEGKYNYQNQSNPGAPLNSPYDENSVFIHPDGKTLFFSSNRMGSLGGYDIFMSRREGSKWLPPVNLGYPINTMGDEIYFSLSPDGNTAWLSSRRPESINGSYDVYAIDLSQYVFPLDRAEDGPNKPTVCLLQGKVLSKSTAEPLEVELVLETPEGEVIETFESAENGTFLLSVDGNRDYVLKVDLNGYKPSQERFKVERKEGQTQSVTKVFLLEPND